MGMTSPSNAGSVGLILGWEAMIPTCLTTNKDFKKNTNGPHKKKKLTKKEILKVTSLYNHMCTPGPDNKRARVSENIKASKQANALGRPHKPHLSHTISQ